MRAVGGRPLPADAFATAGALEIAVHGWDVAQARGAGLPIPAELASRLLAVAPLLVTDAHRASLFGPPVAVPLGACASDRLAGFLGRAAARPEYRGADTCCQRHDDTAGRD
ncbi:MAG: hypothetical protein ACRDOK_06465 [Streptosporangiaceae bacterium]